MPQMMPLNWLFLPFLFIFCYILFLVLLFFLVFTNHSLKYLNTLIKPQSLSWVW